MLRRAIVTGTSSGIGAATAEMLASEGYAVWLTWAHDEAGATEVGERCASHGGSVEVSQLDLGEPESIEGLVELVATKWGGLHVLVNNGGVCPYRAYDDIEIDEWDSVMETNARGTFLLTPGRLAAIASVGRRGRPECGQCLFGCCSTRCAQDRYSLRR